MKLASTIIREAEKMHADGDLNGAWLLLRAEERKSTGSLRASKLGNAADRLFSVRIAEMVAA